MGRRKKINIIINELTALPRSADSENIPDMHTLVSKMIDARPNAKLDPKFKRQLKKRILSQSQGVPATNKIITSRRLMLAASFFSVLLILVLLPVVLVRSGVSEKSAPATAFSNEYSGSEDERSIKNPAQSSDVGQPGDMQDMLYQSAPVEKKELPNEASSPAPAGTVMSKMLKVEDIPAQGGESIPEAQSTTRYKSEELPLPSHLADTAAQTGSTSASDSADADGLMLLPAEADDMRIREEGRTGSSFSAVPSVDEITELNESEAEKAVKKRTPDKSRKDNDKQVPSASVSVNHDLFNTVLDFFEAGQPLPENTADIIPFVNTFSGDFFRLQPSAVRAVYSVLSRTPWNNDTLLLLIAIPPSSGVREKLSIIFNSSLFSDYQLSGSGQSASANTPFTINRTGKNEYWHILLFELKPDVRISRFPTDGKLQLCRLSLNIPDNSGLDAADPVEISESLVPLNKTSEAFRLVTALAMWTILLENPDKADASAYREVQSFLPSPVAAESIELVEFRSVLERMISIGGE